MQQNLTTRGSERGAGSGAATAAVRARVKARPDRPYDLLEMAQRDLNAALHLLAQRAEYITQAGGAAIALRRDGRNEMMCRARAGVNAPEVGALFSTEVGLSGESVRTAQPLRCNDAAHDGRVNRAVCRELGIASVMVMPIVNDDRVMGVFELFSGKTNAFGERDQAALQRLSEMVGIAVRLARAAEATPESLKSAIPAASLAAASSVAPTAIAKTDPRPAPPNAPIQTSIASPSAAVQEQKKKLWSALEVPGDLQPATEQDQSRIPPILRKLRKCDACGFPVSPGRSLCVECEEKKWRGRSTASPATTQQSQEPPSPAIPVAAPARKLTPASADGPQARAQHLAQQSLASFTLSAGIEPPPSWLAAHKYVIVAVLAVAAVITALLLR